MSEKYTLEISGFRSIRSASVDIAPLTVIYGPNGSGKSSLIYGLLTLKNFLTNPNRNLPSLFNYPTIDLGGFREVVSRHNADGTISAALSVSDDNGACAKFSLSMAESGGESKLCLHDRGFEPSRDVKMGVEIGFPYRANQEIHSSIGCIAAEPNGNVDMSDVNLIWNGVGLRTRERSPIWNGLLTWANGPMGLIRSTCFAPLRRGFGSPAFGVASVTSDLGSDEEVASLLATDRNLKYAVGDKMEPIIGRRVDVHFQIGASAFNLDSIPKNGGVPVAMVNEGFGTNQLAYLLTLCLYEKAKIVAIEEPEIHLHPAMVRKLVHAMVDIVSKGDKRIIVSTHSETFVVALLARIAAGEISVDDVSFILAENPDGESVFTKNAASPNGQLEGGLHSFIASELEDMAVFLGLDESDINEITASAS